jgi:hypothetical protein
MPDYASASQAHQSPSSQYQVPNGPPWKGSIGHAQPLLLRRHIQLRCVGTLEGVADSNADRCFAGVLLVLQ